MQCLCCQSPSSGHTLCSFLNHWITCDILVYIDIYEGCGLLGINDNMQNSFLLIVWLNACNNRSHEYSGTGCRVP